MKRFFLSVCAVIAACSAQAQNLIVDGNFHNTAANTPYSNTTVSVSNGHVDQGAWQLGNQNGENSTDFAFSAPGAAGNNTITLTNRGTNLGAYVSPYTTIGGTTLVQLTAGQGYQLSVNLIAGTLDIFVGSTNVATLTTVGTNIVNFTAPASGGEDIRFVDATISPGNSPRAVTFGNISVTATPEPNSVVAMVGLMAGVGCLVERRRLGQLLTTWRAARI